MLCRARGSRGLSGACLQALHVFDGVAAPAARGVACRNHATVSLPSFDSAARDGELASEIVRVHEFVHNSSSSMTACWIFRAVARLTTLSMSLRSEEHTSALPSLMRISYDVIW